MATTCHNRNTFTKTNMKNQDKPIQATRAQEDTWMREVMDWLENDPEYQAEQEKMFQEMFRDLELTVN